MDLVDQVVSLFEQQVPGFINELEMATREQNTGDTRRVAHAFKSSAMNIGAHVLGERLAAIEAAAQDNQTALTNEEMNGLESLVRDSLRQLLASYARIRSELSSGAQIQALVFLAWRATPQINPPIDCMHLQALGQQRVRSDPPLLT